MLDAITTDDTLLRTHAVTKRFGGIIAVEALDIALPRHGIVGVIGPNGAGKSTLIGLLGGALAPTTGEVIMDGRTVTRIDAAGRARLGIGRTYQIPRPFLEMTVLENLLAAQFAVRPTTPGREARARAWAILDRSGLSDAANTPARLLTLLRRKRLELARAVALRPRLLMLDEVGAGLVDSEISQLIELILNLSTELGSILIVEHVIRVVRECCSRLIVLNFGRLLVDGPTSEVLRSDDVAAVYLGTRHGSKQGDAIDASGSAPAIKAPEIAALLATNGVKGARAGDPPIIELRDVSAGYGQARVLNKVTLSIRAGQTVALVGTNGAGKTTLTRVLNGIVKPFAGELLIGGVNVTRWPSHRIAALGTAHCMEGRRIFAGMSVEENLLVAARGSGRTEKQRRLAHVYELFAVLRERRTVPGTVMSGGEQQMLAIGRALMSRPRALVFDEISLGLAPVMVDRLYDALRALRRAGATMLIVEQDVDRAFDLADEAHVLERGTIVLSGRPDEIRSDERLRQIYIGARD